MMSTSIRMEPFKFQSPTTIAMYAPPYSGKSTLTKKILENADELFTTPPHLIVYCYNHWLDDFTEMKNTVKNLVLHQGIPTSDDIDTWANGNHFILVLDDLQQQCQKDKRVSEMFTVGSHHRNFSLIYLCHNIFGKGSFSRTINLNTHYIILFRNNRDRQQIETLGRQIYGKKCEYFLDAYKKATSTTWGYLLIDLHPNTISGKEKLLTNIIPGDTATIYLPQEVI